MDPIGYVNKPDTVQYKALTKQDKENLTLDLSYEKC